MNDSPTTTTMAGRADAAESFVELLFTRTAPEDLAAYSASELAALARDAWSFLQVRKPGAPKLRFEPAIAPPGTKANPKATAATVPTMLRRCIALLLCVYRCPFFWSGLRTGWRHEDTASRPPCADLRTAVQRRQQVRRLCYGDGGHRASSGRRRGTAKLHEVARGAGDALTMASGDRVRICR